MSLYHRKAFVQIAELLKETNADDLVIEAFVDLFSNDNHKFIEEKFRAAIVKDNEGY
tara:strand:- start:589 stop:759 length:171 start_codon:yes stop_codon:yes gene_type:complete